MYEAHDGTILLDTGPSRRGAHRFGTASVCLRRYALDAHGKLNGWERASSPALLQGTMMHLALAHHYAHKAFRDGAQALPCAGMVLDTESIKRVPTPAMALAEFCLRDQTGHADQYHGPVLACYDAYTKRYRGESNWQVVSVETEYAARIPGLPPDRSLYTQRADLLIRDKITGLYHFVDHKKAYAIVGKTARQYVLSGQMLGYVLLGRLHLGPEACGQPILNRMKIAPPEFHRAIVEPAPAAVKSYLATLRHAELAIMANESRPDSGDPMTWPGVMAEEVCFGKYGECPHFNRCQHGLP